MKKIFLIATLLFSIAAIGQEVNIIPQPKSLEIKSGNFQLD